jgi:DNA helicase-2/ATP-dependent DNA helicase PcrA
VQRISDSFRNIEGLQPTLEAAIEDQCPLAEFVDIASRFKGTTIEFVSLMQGLLHKVEGGLYYEEEGDAVNLLTYFRAKGRQWNTVILPGLNQKIIPMMNADTDIESERRIFYVALTRVTSNLILSYVRNAARAKVERSQFLDEMAFEAGEEKRAKDLGGEAASLDEGASS